VSTMRTSSRAMLAGIRRHPGRALAVCAALAAASVITSTSLASAGPEASLAVSQAELHAAPAPLVMNFDSGMSGTQVKSGKPADSIPAKWSDGCDHDYGQPGVCVPWQIPAPNPAAACAWLKANGFLPIKVYGINRQDLPENAEGYVCAGAS
jgi:hypothetical protein